MIYSFSNSGFRDPETGVYNQTYFMEVFNREWHRHIRDHQGLALLYLCPHIHETITQPHLLEIFMKKVKEAMLRTTDMIARLDNQSFALGLFEVDDKGAQKVVDRITNNLNKFNEEYSKRHPAQVEYELGGCVCMPNSEIYIESLFENVEKLTLKLKQTHNKNAALIHL